MHLITRISYTTRCNLDASSAINLLPATYISVKFLRHIQQAENAKVAANNTLVKIRVIAFSIADTSVCGLLLFLHHMTLRNICATTLANDAPAFLAQLHCQSDNFCCTLFIEDFQVSEDSFYLRI